MRNGRTPRRLPSWVVCGLASLVLFGMTATVWAAPPTVVTVPWRGALNLDHETYNGKAIHLKGVASGLVAGATASWDPGDGTAAKPVTPNPDAAGFDFDLGVVHTYPNAAPGTPFTATLTVCNGSDCATKQYRVVVRNRTLDVEINIAIDQALWYLHRTQTRGGTYDGNWGYPSNPAYGDCGSYTSYCYASSVASAVQAFQINNHFETGDPNNDPYADTVKRGLKYLFSKLRALTPTALPDGRVWDSNGNGLGVEVSGTRPIYEGGQVMDAIVASKTPDAVTTTGPANIVGRTYRDIVQDMVDMYAWGQYDSDVYGGGWRYNWNDFPDNSACQWGAIGILAARDLFGATVPAWLYERNLAWLNYSSAKTGVGAYCTVPNCAYGYGYTGAGAGDAQSPSGLVQLVMDGIPKSNAERWQGVENYLAAAWNSWYRDTQNYYALFALAKAMRLALPSPIVIMSPGTTNAIDWFKADCASPDACVSSEKWGVARTILRDQNANGQFTAGGPYAGGALAHAWATIILTGTLQLEPVAVATAHPNPGAQGVPVTLDGSGSYHQDPAKSIVTYEWVFGDGATGTGMTVNHIFPCPSIPCQYTVSLIVTDNSTPTPLVNTANIVVRITNPPHPPTANTGGPYLACVNESFQLDGSKSFDIDAALGDVIKAYGWELDFVQPLDFDEATGVKPTVGYAAAGKRDVGLRVTDNSSGLFPPSPDLTDQAFSTVDVWDCSCFGSIAARAKPGSVDVVWAPVAGAASYDIYRSTTGPNAGFALIKAGHVTTYAVYADFNVVNGTKYWYRVAPKPAVGATVCGGSAAVSATPMARTR